MTVWLPLQRSFLALFRFLCQICEFSQFPRPGFWQGWGEQPQLGTTWPARFLDRDTEIIKFIRHLYTENVTFGRCGTI